MQTTHDIVLSMLFLYRGLEGMPPGNLRKPVLLRLNVEVVLIENYEAVKLMVGS